MLQLEEKINKIEINMGKERSSWMQSIAMGSIPKNKHLAILLSLLPQQQERKLVQQKTVSPSEQPKIPDGKGQMCHISLQIERLSPELWCMSR